MKKIYISSLFSFLLGVTLLLSCDKDEARSDVPATFEVRLTDAPAPYEEVNVDIQSISIHINSDELSGWQERALDAPGAYNLLDFQNGLDTLLISETFPVGNISQIRLILGNDNTLVKDGVTYDLETPSAQQSGLKININADLNPGVAYKLWLDFDATRSIVEKGNGGYSLKPTLRAYSEATGGSLKGIVSPVEAEASVWAVLGTDSLMTYPNENGEFLIAGMMEGGDWKVLVDANEATGYQDKIMENINIVSGEVTNLDTIALMK